MSDGSGTSDALARDASATAAVTRNAGPGGADAGREILAAADLRVVRGGRTLVAVERFAVRAGEVHVLLGPNGAGKSTLLSALNALEPAEGDLVFEGAPARSRAARLRLRRRTAAVFQRPHLLSATVLGNVEKGLRLRGVPRDEARHRAIAALDLLGIGHLAERRREKLSGGEAQRVSIARALAVDPVVLFLDEPLAALDPPSRRALTTELLRIFECRAMAVLWVTHDRDEALAVGDRVSFIERGAVVQTGPVGDVFARPSSASVADYLGLETYLRGRIRTAPDGEATQLVLDGGVVVTCSEAPDGPAVACLPPEDVVLFRAPPSEGSTSLRNVVEGTVKAVTPAGRMLHVVVACDRLEVGALVTRAAFEELELRVGAPATAAFKASAVHPIPSHEQGPQARASDEGGR